MKIQLDLKSSLCGVLLGVLIMIGIAAAGRPEQSGRFQIQTGVTGTGGYAIILDTATGKAWGRVKDFAHDDGFYAEK